MKRNIVIIFILLLFNFTSIIKVKCISDVEDDTNVNEINDFTTVNDNDDKNEVKDIAEDNILDNEDTKYETSDYSVTNKKNVSISYQSHVQNIGWQVLSYDGMISGTEGRSLRVEGIKINLNDNDYDGNIEYQSYVEGYGWQNWVTSGSISGTVGESRRLEAMRIRLTGNLAEHYDVYYRAHVQNLGWLGWAKNGESAGSQGYGYRMEAYQIMLVEKGMEVPSSNLEPFKSIKISYQAHVQNIGWQVLSYDGMISGTEGCALRVEGIKINLNDNDYDGNIEYQSYVEGYGWQNWVTSGSISGTVGESRRLEAMRIRLTGNLAEHYDVYYRAHVQNLGWLGWAKNGQSAGSQDYNYRMEAYQIMLVEKDKEGPNIDEEAFIYRKLSYKSYIQNIGWQDYKFDNDVSGTLNQSLMIKGIQINVSNEKYSGSIQYQSHVQDIGWIDWTCDGNTSGVVSSSKRIEAIKIRLTGDLEEHYDVYYRTHVQNIGWLGWAKNGEAAGSQGYGYRMEAYQIILVEKGADGPSSNEEAFKVGWLNDGINTYYTFPDGTKATGIQKIDGVRYVFDSDGRLKYSNIKIYADISSHQGNIDFDELYNSGSIDGIILRIGYWTSEDAYFSKYLSEIKRLNIPYTVYLFSYAHNSNEALSEAQNMLNLYTKYQLHPAMNVYYDLEGYSTTIDNSDDITKEQYQQIAESFIWYLDINGIGARIYSYTWFAHNRFNEATRKHLDWIAQYSENNTYNYAWRGWQYTDAGKIPGINTDVDLSIFLY